MAKFERYRDCHLLANEVFPLKIGPDVHRLFSKLSGLSLDIIAEITPNFYVV